jgi:hypothetical protein
MFSLINYKNMKIKEILTNTLSITGLVVFIILIGFSLFNFYKTLAPNWGIGNTGDDAPYFSASCQKFKDNFELTTSINTSGKEINNVTCQLVSNGGMITNNDKVEFPFISSNSSDVCSFILTGEPTSVATIRMTYTIDGFWGDKNSSTIITPYPDCSMDSEPEYTMY